MRKFVLFAGIFLPVFFLNAQTTDPAENGQPGFIIDELYTFIHAGPGRNYRILGSIIAGTQVQKIGTSEDGTYVEVVDDKQRTGWVDARFFSEAKSLRLRIPELENAIDESQRQLNQYRDQAQALKSQLDESQALYQSVEEKYQALQLAHQKSQSQLEDSDSAEQQEWLIKGGILAVGSLLLGVILTFLPRGRRRSDKWM